MEFLVFVLFLSGLVFWIIIFDSLISRVFMRFKRLSEFGKVLFYDTGLDRNLMHKVCKYHNCQSCKFYEKNCKGFLND